MLSLTSDTQWLLGGLLSPPRSTSFAPAPLTNRHIEFLPLYSRHSFTVGVIFLRYRLSFLNTALDLHHVHAALSKIRVFPNSCASPTTPSNLSALILPWLAPQRFFNSSSDGPLLVFFLLLFLSTPPFSLSFSPRSLSLVHYFPLCQ